MSCMCENGGSVWQCQTVGNVAVLSVHSIVAVGYVYLRSRGPLSFVQCRMSHIVVPIIYADGMHVVAAVLWRSKCPDQWHMSHIAMYLTWDGNVVVM